jgi:hypothetical protein
VIHAKETFDVILKPVRVEEVRRAGKVRSSYRIVDDRGEPVAWILSGWGKSDEQRHEKALDLVRTINSGR